MNKYDFKTQPAILIQGAMDSETEYLIGQLKDKTCVSVGNWRFYTGFLGRYEEPVILSKTYQGMVNASAATSLAMVSFHIKAVINQGIAGGHDPKMHLGDIVLGEKVVPMGAVMRGYSAAGTGIDETDFELLKIEVYNGNERKTEKVEQFMCDQRLLALAERVQCPQRKVRGVLGSADEWNNQLDRIALLRERYHTTAEDMESAAVAQLCLSYGVPFIGIRILSNSIVNNEEFDESQGEGIQRFIYQYVEILHDYSE